MRINGRLTGAVQTPLWIPRSVDPAGGIWSTTRDLIRYARFHISRGTAAGDANVVHPDSLAQMQEPAIAIPGTSLQMGRDWFVQDIDGLRVVYHGGDTLGQHAELVVIPEHDFALVVLTNGQGGGSLAARAALDAALAEIPELAPLVGKIGLLPALLVGADTLTLDLPSAQVAEYAGRYADLGQALTFPRRTKGWSCRSKRLWSRGVAAWHRSASSATGSSGVPGRRCSRRQSAASAVRPRCGWPRRVGRIGSALAAARQRGRVSLSSRRDRG